MERCSNHIHVQQIFIIALQVSKWNLCEKSFKKRNVVVLGVYTARLAMKTKTWAKEKATGAVYSLDMWKETAQRIVQELQPELGSPLWTSSKQDSS
jgi:hypothetical protein